jgi:2-phospho-L-lactate guanylyltransferase
VTTLALVPAKTLATAKSRLAPALSDRQRAEIALEMLGRVLAVVHRTAGIDRCLVVSADERALHVAAAHGAGGLRKSEIGLNRALEGARASFTADDLLVLLSDLPLLTPEDLRAVLESDAPVVIAPSKDGGTNALRLRPPDSIPFRFGRDSARYHRFEAGKRSLAVELVRRDSLAFDVDTPDDLAAYLAVKDGRARLDEILSVSTR